MKINTAADLAAILDPKRSNPEWWTGWNYIGPPDLHTARKYDYLKEEWLEGKRVQIARETERRVFNAPFITTAFKHRVSPDMREGMRKIFGQDPNHSAALVAAIEMVSE